MHMANSLLSPAVCGVMLAASAGGVSYSVAKVDKEELRKKVPMMAAAGAFVFAAQMVNYAIPGTGSSGHIGGGILLAALLGPFASLITIAAVLIIQALFFADGGLLALGCNIFNMGILPCLLVYPLVFKPLTQKGTSMLKIAGASVLSVVLGLQLGAFGVVLQTQASGITELPFATFAGLMQPIHLAIGAIEGVITALVLGMVYKMNAGTLSGSSKTETAGSYRNVVITLAVAAVLVGAGLSLAASSSPDGLEWAISNVTGGELSAQGAIFDWAEGLQDATSFMPDYDFAAGTGSGTSVAGLVGAALTAVLAGGAGLLMIRARRRTADAASR